MLDFYDSTFGDFSDFGRRMWQAAHKFRTHERTSQFIAENFYDEFLTEDNDPQMALVRIYRLTSVDDLPGNILSLFDEDEKQVLALTGTCGIEEAWCDRWQSATHLAVSLSSIARSDSTSMFPEIFDLLDVDLRHLRANQEVIGRGRQWGIACISDVLGYPSIPAQADFVEPYGIKSLLVIGGFMSDGQGGQSVYILLAFSRTRIAQDVLEKASGIPEFFGAALAGRSEHMEIFS